MTHVMLGRKKGALVYSHQTREGDGGWSTGDFDGGVDQIFKAGDYLDRVNDVSDLDISHEFLVLGDVAEDRIPAI